MLLVAQLITSLFSDKRGAQKRVVCVCHSLSSHTLIFRYLHDIEATTRLIISIKVSNP
jgi:hypothetical protein